MSGKFTWMEFATVDLQDHFFDSLKKDYEEFPEWYRKKAAKGEKALVFMEENKVGAFIYLKDEDEELELTDRCLPSRFRIKIGTLKLSEDIRNIRLGEGAIGVALWRWKESGAEEIYLTVFEEHKSLILLIEKFGFECVGKNKRGECVYIKNRNRLEYSDPYKSFPFINPSFKYAGIIPIEEKFHDQLFPYSELQGNKKEIEEAVAGNGISKVYIATPSKKLSYYIGEPLCVYRKFAGERKGFKSVVTSYVTITNIIDVKINGRACLTFEEFKRECGNKTIFSEQTLADIYTNKNVVLLNMIYNGYFGKGNNVNYFHLKNDGLFETYPYSIRYTKGQFESILQAGHVNIDNIFL